MDKVQLWTAIGTVIYAYLRNLGQSGTLKEIVPLADTTNAWIVRFHVVHPYESMESFVVVMRNGAFAVAPRG